MRRRLLRAAGFASRWMSYAGAAVLLLGVVSYVAARLWLPSLLVDKSRIEKSLTDLSGQTVQIEHIQPHWDGIFPGVAVSGVRVFSGNARSPSIILEQVRVTISLLSLLQGKFGIHRLVVVRPHIALERLADNRFRISGYTTSGSRARTPNGRFIEWLFEQKELTIEDGTLQWLDHKASKPEPYYLLGVNLSLSNAGQRHRLVFNADFPADLCIHCAIDIDIEGNPLLGDDWGGRVTINAVGLDLAGLPEAVKNSLPPMLKGRFDLQLSTQWVHGRLRVAQGNIDAFGLRIPALVSKEPLLVDRLRGYVRWQGKAGGWRMDVDNALIGLGGEPWSAGHLRLDHNPDITHARIQHVSVDQLVSFSRHFDVPQRVRFYLDGLNPSGSINDLLIKWDRRADAESRFYLKSRLSNITVRQFGKLPGIEGLSGRLVLAPTRGDLYLDTRDGSLSLPHVFREKISVRRLLGQVHWDKREDHWEITAQDIRLTGDAVARGNLLLRLPFDRTSPHLKLRFDFNSANIRTAGKYYPVNRMRPTLLDWLDKSVISGYGVRGHVVLDGEMRKFPFRDGSGTFEVRADIRDAVFNYLDGWTPVTGAELTLLFRGPAMLITAHSGWIDDLAIRDVVVQKQDLRNRQEPIKVSMRATGPAEATLAVLRASPMATRNDVWRRFLAPGLEAQGPGALTMQITIFPTRPKEMRLQGEYRFQGSQIDTPIAGFQLKNVHGHIRFDEKGIIDGRLDSTFLGEPTAIAVLGKQGKDQSRTVFRVSGVLSAKGLADHFGGGLDKFLSGRAVWDGELEFTGHGPQFFIRSDLAGMQTALPEPYRNLGTKTPQVVLETIESDRNAHRMRVQLGSNSHGVLDFKNSGARWRFAGGHIALGETQVEVPTHEGLHVSLAARHLNGDAWAALFSGAGEGGLPEFVWQLGATAEALEIYGRRAGKFQLNLMRQKGGWQGVIGGDTLEGKIRLLTGDNGRIDLDLNRLRLPPQLEAKHRQRLDPRDFPTLAIKARKFQVGKADLGALDFWGAHTDIGWKILHFNLERPEMRLFADGSWYYVVGHDSVEMELQLISDNMGKTLAALGLKDQMHKGKVDLKIDLRWREDSKRPGLSNMDGKIELSVKDGSLLDVKEGIARLAGALNLSSFGKYLTLNFDPAIGKGFVFSDISGRIAIKNGDAYTDAFSVRGSAADIIIRGRIGLVKEDFDLVADIYPDLRGGVTVAAGWLWGPATAAWILAIQELLKKEIAEGTRITYNITGKWQSPKIVKHIRKPAVNEESDE
ncbi:MAG: YhdP family protein [Acidiferrobacterales bacterium]